MTFDAIRNARNSSWNRRTKKVQKRVLKEFGLLVVMFTVTLGVVFFETGSLDKAAHIATIASPIKALAAGLYHRFT